MKTSLIFLLGIGMGVSLGLLIAPEPGKVTRRKIREEADRIIDKALAKKELKRLEQTAAASTAATLSRERLTLS